MKEGTYYSQHADELKAKARAYYRRNKMRIKAKARSRYKMRPGAASRQRQEKYRENADFANDVREYNRNRQRALRAKKTAKGRYAQRKPPNRTILKPKNNEKD